MQIGGRNLLLGSEDERTAVRSTSNTSFDYDYSPLLKELEEDTFTFSFEARADVEGMSVDFYFRDASTLISQTVYTKLTLDYERYVQPVVLKSGNTVADILYCRFRLNGGTGNVYVQRAMLERGNRATDWIAAPEDEEEKLEQKLATVHAMISTTSDSIRQEVQANYAPVSDMTEVQKQLTTLSEQTEDNFTWTVSQVNALQSDLQTGLEATEEQMELLRTYMTFSSAG